MAPGHLAGSTVRPASDPDPTLHEEKREVSFLHGSLSLSPPALVGPEEGGGPQVGERSEGGCVLWVAD